MLYVIKKTETGEYVTGITDAGTVTLSDSLLGAWSYAEQNRTDQYEGVNNAITSINESEGSFESEQITDPLKQAEPTSPPQAPPTTQHPPR